MTRIKRKRFRRVPAARSITRAPVVERRVVTLSYPSGPRDVDAHVVGPLAVHRADPGGGWRVTHLRTGMGLLRRATYRQAMRIARECAGLDWEFGEFGRPPRFPSVISVEKLRVANVALRAAGIRTGLTLRKKEGIA